VKQVLLVEAENPVREALVKALKAEGYGVITASDKDAASSLFQSLSLHQGKFPFDLLILTCVVPKAEELELCRLLRCQGNLVPIFTLMVKGSETDRISALEVGADDCLCEPFNIQELITRCRILSRRHQLSVSPEPTVLQFEDVSVYLQEHRVLVRGQEVRLSPREFRLLELFMRHPRKIWSTQQLFEQLWESDSTATGGSKTVEVHVRWLRAKIELRPNRPKYIVTVPRVGYRFG
jgi:two-component system phosphate regulon response regulator PhoB